ncbi:MAG TPA: hypothetical protein VGF57_09545 [Roseiarcus sp.]|jgi:ribosomal 50S subunit-associated protein YjgA (DUF615 family)
MMTEAAIRKIVTEVLRERFARLGFLNSEVVLDQDFDGEKIVRVTAHFDRPRDVGESLFDAADTIRARLIEAGDDRFVFVSRDYPGSADEEGSDEEPGRTLSS